MSLQQQDFGGPLGELEQKIVGYLVEHPDFLVRYPEALAALDVPHASGDAVSLVERQVSTLRKRTDDYRRQLEELVAVARENDRLARRLHDLTLALIETRSFDEVLNTLQDKLRDQFQADAVEMKLFSADELAAHGSEAGPALFNDFLERGKPSCGQLEEAQLGYLFGNLASEAGSVALIPLQAPPHVGVLAIGSRDPLRFTPGKGVDFLQRLAEVVSATLGAVCSPGS